MIGNMQQLFLFPNLVKDPADTNNYRPLAFTSCLCKTLVRMINKRLTWFLKSNNHISRFQSGFRSDRSTTDNLVRLETFTRDAFIKKEYVVAVFLKTSSQTAPCKSELAPLCLTIMTRSKVYLKGVFCLQHFLVSKLMIL